MANFSVREFVCYRDFEWDHRHSDISFCNFVSAAQNVSQCMRIWYHFASLCQRNKNKKKRDQRHNKSECDFEISPFKSTFPSFCLLLPKKNFKWLQFKEKFSRKWNTFNFGESPAQQCTKWLYTPNFMGFKCYIEMKMRSRNNANRWWLKVVTTTPKIYNN